MNLFNRLRRKMHIRTERPQPLITQFESLIDKSEIKSPLINELSYNNGQQTLETINQPVLQSKLEIVDDDDLNDVEMIDDSSECADDSPQKLNGKERECSVSIKPLVISLPDEVDDVIKEELVSQTEINDNASPIETDSSRLEIESEAIVQSVEINTVEIEEKNIPLNPETNLQISEADTLAVEPIQVVVSEVRADILVEPHQQQSTQTDPIQFPPETRKRTHPETVDNNDEITSALPPSKRLCDELERNFGAHDKTLREYIDNTANNDLDEVRRHLNQLQADIVVLNELSDAKEIEWNNILHLRKCKEEIIVRLNRRKIVMEIMASKMGDVPVNLDGELPSVSKQLAKELKMSSASDIGSGIHASAAVAAFSQPSTTGTSSIAQSILASRANMKSADLAKEKANTTRLHR